MHLKNKPPVFVPREFRSEIEKMSKAMLMDLAWDFAKMSTPSQDDGSEATDGEIMDTLRSQAITIQVYRS